MTNYEPCEFTERSENVVYAVLSAEFNDLVMVSD